MPASNRGRPQVTDKLTLLAGKEKVTLSYIESDNRVQISLPGDWAMVAMSASAGRKRIDLVNSNPPEKPEEEEEEVVVVEEKKPAAKKKAKAAPKAKAKANAKKPEIEVVEDHPPNKTDAPVKRARRNRKTLFSG